jgi:hypothetical protein
MDDDPRTVRRLECIILIEGEYAREAELDSIRKAYADLSRGHMGVPGVSGNNS